MAAQLKNTYWCIRHGHSNANAKDVIVSTLEEGTNPKWGLSELGKSQANTAGHELQRLFSQEGVNVTTTENPSSDDTAIVVVTSPFTRCVETATRVAAAINITPTDTPSKFMQNVNLIERSFGSYELQSCENYKLVWVEDAVSIESRPPGGGESVVDVSNRLKTAINELEQQYTGAHIVIVSHGDSLSILAATLLGSDLGQHRQYGLFNCGILRIPTAPQ